GVAHGKPLTDHAVEIGIAREHAIQQRVARNNMIRTETTEIIGRAHDDATTGQALADIIVTFAHQIERDAVRQERAKALTRRAIELNMDSVIRQALMTIFSCDST